MPKTLSLLAVLKKIDTKGLKSLSDPQWNTFLASDTEPNEIEEKIKKLERLERQGFAYDKTGELILEDSNAMIERFRQRTGRAQGRESLKVKKSKIDVASFKKEFLNKKEEPVKADTTGTSTLTNFRPSIAASGSEENTEETEGLKGIRDVLDDILKVLRLDFKGDRKEARDAKKAQLADKRKGKEDKLEQKKGGSEGIGKAVKSMLSPFTSIWDKIINFLKWTLVGVLFNKVLKWFTNPKNKKKVEAVGRFFKDWWPALATAAALFLTPLGALVKGMIGLLTAIIPKLVMAIAANPWAAAAVVGSVGIWGVSKLIGGKKGEEEKGPEEFASDSEPAAISTSSENQQQDLELNEQQMIESRQEFNEGGLVYRHDKENGKYHYNEGGAVQHFIHKYNKGGLVFNFNEGGMVGKELVYSLKKFNTETVVKGDEVERIKTRENTTGAIQLEDLYRHQDQILSQLPEGTTIESIVDGTSGIDPQVLYPILQTSDAQAASTAKERAITMQMMQENNLINPDNTVKGHMSYNANFGGLGGDSEGLGALQDGVPGFNKGGQVPGSGNTDTVPAMLTPGEFVMSKGAVNKYGVDTLENMNAAAGSVGARGPAAPVSSKGSKGDTVPSMLTPGEFVISAPAVQQFGVKTLESMNLKGGGNNKPELKVMANKGGLIKQYLRNGGVVGNTRIVPVGAPVIRYSSRTVTLPTIKKQEEDIIPAKSDNEIPQFRIPIVSTQRSMVLSSLGIADLLGGE